MIMSTGKLNVLLAFEEHTKYTKHAFISLQLVHVRQKFRSYHYTHTLHFLFCLLEKYVLFGPTLSLAQVLVSDKIHSANILTLHKNVYSGSDHSSKYI